MALATRFPCSHRAEKYCSPTGWKAVAIAAFVCSILLGLMPPTKQPTLRKESGTGQYSAPEEWSLSRILVIGDRSYSPFGKQIAAGPRARSGISPWGRKDD